jgi:hypothetical protein
MTWSMHPLWDKHNGQFDSRPSAECHCAGATADKLMSTSAVLKRKCKRSVRKRTWDKDHLHSRSGVFELQLPHSCLRSRVDRWARLAGSSMGKAGISAW